MLALPIKQMEPDKCIIRQIQELEPVKEPEKFNRFRIYVAFEFAFVNGSHLPSEQAEKLKSETSDLIAEEYGGCTVYNHVGSWVEQKKGFKVFSREQGYTFESLYKPTASNHPKWIAEHVKNVFNQKEVILTIDENISTFFV